MEPVGDVVEPPQVALSLKRLVFGLLEESGHDMLAEGIDLVNTKRSFVNPGDNICEAFGLSGIQNDMKSPWKCVFIFGAYLGVVLKNEGRILAVTVGYLSEIAAAAETALSSHNFGRHNNNESKGLVCKM